MNSKRRDYRLYHQLQFEDQEIYDEIVGLINIDSVGLQCINGSDYRKTLAECLHFYVEIVEDTVRDKSIHKTVQTYCDKIKEIVKASYEGFHSRAYTKLQNLLRMYGEQLFTVVKANSEFYRMRVSEKRKGLQREDIFHIPLNLRRCIKTQRFSFPGYPCLYLGKSLYVCWEEMNMPSTETTLVSGFKNTSEIKLVDLRVPSLYDFLNHSEKYVLLFPLILASSIPVVNKEDVFKPEYILPQLILEWVISKRNETSAIGIYYTSVLKNNDFFGELDEEWNNIAIPVQKPLASSKFCPVLQKIFILTKPTCYEYEHIMGKIDTVGVFNNGPNRLNSSTDNKREYYISQFSRMEELLLEKQYDNVFVNDPD